jgi:hypothetical protein
MELSFAEAASDFDSAQTGQHDVEENHVELRGPGGGER